MGKKKSNVSEISEASFDGGEPTPEVLALRSAIHSMKHEVMRYRREAHQAIVQADESRRSQVELRMLLKDMANALDARTIQVATMESKCMHLETLVDGSAPPAHGGSKLASKSASSSGPTAAVSTAGVSDGKKVKELEAALATAEAKLAKLGDAGAKLTAAAKREAELEQRLAETEKALEAAEEAAADLEDKYLKGEALRRSLHNQIMDLKGAIRVFCRVRPALEGPQFAQLPTGEPVVQFSIEDDRGIDLMERNQRYGFNFDRVFQPKHSQEQVFEEISQLVQSAVDGYKVCIFAYGQTGSGKTHTMLGSTSQRGMIPRSVEQIFNTVQDLEVDGWSFELSASMLEIYNEEYRCLLGPGPPPGQKMKVSHDERGTMVTYLEVVDVRQPQAVNDLISRAMSQRACSATNMNEQSSRSHMVFMLNINGYHDERGEEVHGALNLIDLAGSERLSRSGATGDRLKETQAINKSLSSLGDVIVALANREQHVPYRNSKLTYLLQGSLGGSAKTLMFVNISPTLESSQESLCSLRFASKVNACELGQAKKSMKRSGSAKSSVDLTAIAY